ncbi:MAG: hypothetical protein AB1512_18800 [Thermodesulfobacteriota bacterium]
MNIVEQIFLWIGRNFTTESYMFHSKIQVILWSAADIILVLALLKIVTLGRRKAGLKGPLARYVLLFLTAVLTPLLLFSRTPREFLLLECIICGGQFLILLYTVIFERKTLLDLVLRRTPDRPPPTPF